MIGRAQWTRSGWIRYVSLVATLGALFLVQPVANGAESLTVWFYSNDWARHDVMETLLDEFSAQSGIQIEKDAMGGSEVHEKIKVAVAAGSAPDVAILNREQVMTWAILNGILEPVDSYLGPDFSAGAFVESTMQEVRFQGRLYGLPFDFQLKGLYWNNQLFEKAGLPGDVPPQTIDDLTTYNEKMIRIAPDGTIDQLGFYPIGDNWNARGWVWAHGGNLFDWDAGRPTIDTRQNLKAYAWFDEWAQRYPVDLIGDFYARYGGRWNGLNAFRAGRVGILPHAATFITRIRREQPDLQFKTGAVPHAPEGRNGVWAGGLAVIIPKGSQNPQGAGQLIRFLTSEATQREWFEKTERFPVNKTALQSVEIDDANMRAMVAQASDINPLPPLMDVIGPAISKARMSVLRLAATPSQALADAQQEVDARFSDANFAERWGK